MENVKVFFVIGDKLTGNTQEGAFDIDPITAREFSDDNKEAINTFNSMAKDKSGLNTTYGAYCFWISDGDCKRANLPDIGVSKEQAFEYFYKVFNSYYADPIR